MDAQTSNWTVGRWLAAIFLAYVLGMAILGPCVFMYGEIKRDHPRVPAPIIVLWVIAAVFRIGGRR